MEKLRSQSGTSIIIALIFFLLCAVVGTVVLTGAMTNVGRVSTDKQEKIDYLTVSSAAELLRDNLLDVEFVVTDVKTGVYAINASTPNYGTETAEDTVYSTTDSDYLLSEIYTATKELCIANQSKLPNETVPEQTIKIAVEADDKDIVTGSLTIDENYRITIELYIMRDGNEVARMLVYFTSKSQTATQTTSVRQADGDYLKTETTTNTITWSGGTIVRGE